MLSLSVYKVVHVLGVVVLFMGLGAALSGSGRRRLATMSHGIGLVIILVAGFGALARLGIHGFSNWPLWLWLKLVIWVLLGASLAMSKRSAAAAKALWWIVPVLGAAAAYLAIYKPT